MFQLKLQFKLENLALPKNLDHSIISFLKASAQKSSQEFYEELYVSDSYTMKSFTFSYYLPGARFEKERILLSEAYFTLYFSGYRMDDMIRFYNGFIGMRNHRYPLNDNSMTLISVTMQKRQKVTDSEIIIKMLSPLIVRKHDGKTNQDSYYTCKDDCFSNVLKENVAYFLKLQDLNLSTENFSVLPVKGRKVVVPVFDRNTDASLGIYKLAGDPQLLNLLYLAGLGSRRSCGHGKFEILA